jgi:integrase/recombinase XerD
MSGLRQAADEYLALRRALGFKLVSQGYLLGDFVAYAERAGADTVTIELALAWAQLPAGKDPVWCALRLGVVRGFARHLVPLDGRTEVPPADLLPRRRRRATPYPYAPADIAALMAAARGLPLALQAATYETVIGLLAVTGLRISEAIGLDRADIDWQAGVLKVLASKFGKSREVALHPSTVAALRGYAATRDRLCPAPPATSFLVSTVGTRLIAANVRRTFARLAASAGLTPRSPRCRPRLHDFRHGFAVSTLLDWYRAGADVEAQLPLLSTYLGHVDPHSTYVYLEAAPDLLALAADRLERSLEQL